MSDSSSSEEEQQVKKAPASSAAALSASTSSRKQQLSSSSSSSGSDSESSAEDVKKSSSAAAQKGKQSKFHDSDEDSDDDGGGRVVLSAKDKATEQLSALVKEMKSTLGDWTATKDAFERLNKTLAKFQKRGEPTLEPYLEGALWLEARVAELTQDKDSQKKLSAARYKAFSALSSKLAKNLQPYQAEMAQKRAKMEQHNLERQAQRQQQQQQQASSEEEEESASSSEEDSSSSSDSDSSSESGSGSDDDSDDSSSSEEDSDDDSDSSSSSSSSSSSDSESESDEEVEKPTGRDKWLKKSVLDARKRGDAGKPDKPERGEPVSTGPQITAAQQAEDKRLKRVEQEEQLRLKKLHEEEERKAQEASIVLVFEDVERLIYATASKLWAKNVNRRELAQLLRLHAARAEPFGPALQIPALMYLVACQFDQKSIDECMSLDRWRSAMKDMQKICDLLESSPELELHNMPLLDEETLTAVMDSSASTASEAVAAILSECLKANKGDAPAVLARERASKALKASRLELSAGKPNAVFVMGDLPTYVLRLHSELNKALKVTPSHSEEFAQRLADESTVMFHLSESVQRYLERRGDVVQASKQAVLQVELLYFKPQEAGDKIASRVHVIFATGELSTQYRALLMQIYHHALHDRYHEARDMLLQSHLASTMTDNSDPDLVLLVNRCLVQLGMSAFRLGLFKEAHSLLADICAQGKAKELLAQGIVWRKPYDRDEAKENVERRRLLPAHMHVDLELMEAMHLTSAMLLEIASQQQYSQLGEDEQQQQQWVISRTFRRYLDAYERSIFTGPPENIRDHIMASALALREGDWQTCSQHICQLKVWDSQPAGVKDMLVQRIKQDALKVYLVSFAACYDALCVESLMEMFALERAKVKQVMAKLLLSQKSTLAGCFEEDERIVRLHRIVPTALQALSLQLSDKAREVVESNERLMERLTGGNADKAEGGGGEKRTYNKGPGGGGGAGGGGGGNQRRPVSSNNSSSQQQQQSSSGGNNRLVEQGFRPDRSSSATVSRGKW